MIARLNLSQYLQPADEGTVAVSFFIHLVGVFNQEQYL